MPATSEVYSTDYFDYQQKRSALRKFIRKAYLNDIKRYCIGKTIDFGCGIGELLQVLPAQSIGFEINPVAVEFCRAKGLSANLYDTDDDYNFKMLERGLFKTFTMNHVLEHLENPHEVIHKIFNACERLGIQRIIFTVPGHKGFLSDKTHITFIDMKYFTTNNLLNDQRYGLKLSKYYPFNNKRFSKYFTHNELRIVFDKKS
jgi:SAM-dependent methyltransferase